MSSKQGRQWSKQTKNYETGLRFRKTNENAKQRLLLFRNALKGAAQVSISPKRSRTPFSQTVKNDPSFFLVITESAYAT